MDRETGFAIEYLDHIRQSVQDILTTFPMERIYLNTYGANCREQLAAGLDYGLMVLIKQRIAQALNTFEPRISVTNIDLDATQNGYELTVVIYAIVKTNNENIIINGVIS